MIYSSAGGSVMLMGEHAVLHGSHALVAELNQKIYLELNPRKDSQVHIFSSLGEYHGDLNQLDNHPQLAFCIATITAIQPSQGFDLNIKSELKHTVGLGSSAALVAAMVAALGAQYRQPFDRVWIFNTGLGIIRAVQGRGSGSDLAASVFGGVVAYRPAPFECQPLLSASQHLPQLNLFYSGYKTTTAKVLAMVQQWQQQEPQLYDNLYQQMRLCCDLARAAAADGNWQRFGRLMNHYHGLLDALGVCDGTLAQIVYQLRAQQGVLGAKISGSGLGDCVLSLAEPASLLKSDHAHIGVSIANDGVMVRT